VRGRAHTAGSIIRQYDCGVDQANQLWRLEPVPGTTSCSIAWAATATSDPEGALTTVNALHNLLAPGVDILLLIQGFPLVGYPAAVL
jgi:hypothetical protein